MADDKKAKPKTEATHEENLAGGEFLTFALEDTEAAVIQDVIAFLTSVAEFVGEEDKYLPFGMPSSWEPFCTSPCSF